LEKALLSLKEKNIPVQVNRFGSMISLFFTSNQVKEFEDVKNSDMELFQKFFWHLVDHGVMIPPSAYESWFLNSSLDDNMIHDVAEVIYNFSPA
jgi:glutamate-1-semialdehyde 2,1-aminomutase